MLEQAVDRRGLFRFARNGALRTALVVGVNVGAGAIQESKTATQDRLHDEEIARQLQQGDLQVGDFTPNILDASSRLISDKTGPVLGGAMLGWLSADVLGGYLLRNKSRLVNNLTGVASFVLGKTIDNVSTAISVGPDADPRFKEYGFDYYYRENNPLFSPNPSRKEVAIKGSLLTMLFAVTGWNFPSLSRGYLGASPFIAGSNLETARSISVSLDLGDQVKALIASGKSEGEIKTYLQGLGASGKQNLASSKK